MASSVQVNKPTNESKRLKRGCSLHLSLKPIGRSVSTKASPLLHAPNFQLDTVSEPETSHKSSKSIGTKALKPSSLWNWTRSISLNSSFNHGNSNKTSVVSFGSEKEDGNERRLLRRKLSRRLTRGSTKSMKKNMSLLTKEELREKFRHAIRMVCLFVRFHLALMCYSQEKNGQSLDQLNYYSMESEFTTETLVFRKSYFSASNVVYMPAWASKVLSSPPWQRSQSDLTHIASLIRRFFSKTFLEDNLLYLCKHCIYTRYEKKRVLIRSGHQPLYCYLLFSGSVFVNIEQQDEGSGRRYYSTKSVLKQGALFGEIGVIYNRPRTATIITRENVECLLIPPDVCLRVFPEEIDRDYKLRLSYVKESDLFEGWPDEALHQMCVVSKTLEYAYDEVIDRNTRDSEFVYMVVKGRVEIMCYIDLASSSASCHDEKEVLAMSASLPPVPVPQKLSLSGKEQLQELMVVSIDYLYPFQSCDLSSLIKSLKPAQLILVSRGAVVIRFPKLCLQTIPPLKCWKALLEKAKVSPRYPGTQVLSRLCNEHREWSAYKKLVLLDTFNMVPGHFHAMKSRLSRTAVAKLPPTTGSAMDEEMLNLEEFKDCIQSNDPLHDLVRHKHRGPCLQSWNYLNSGRTKRSLSMS